MAQSIHTSVMVIAKLLHAFLRFSDPLIFITVAAVFMGAKHSYIRYSDRAIAKFNVCLILQYSNIASFNDFFKIIFFVFMVAKRS